MAIVRRTHDNSRLVEIHKRIKLLCLSLADDIEFKADVLRATFEIPEPFFFYFSEPLADTAALMEAGLVTGFFGQDFIVEFDRVVMERRYGVIVDEVRAAPGGV